MDTIRLMNYREMVEVLNYWELESYRAQMRHDWDTQCRYELMACYWMEELHLSGYDIVDIMDSEQYDRD